MLLLWSVLALGGVRAWAPHAAPHSPLVRCASCAEPTEELASRLGAGAVDAAGERGDAAFRAALFGFVKGDKTSRRALDELRVRVRRNDAGLERNAVRARLALVDELRREKAGR